MVTKKDYFKDLESTQGFDEGFQGSYIETCNVGIDLAITNGLGLPLGDWITIFGGYGSGKTCITADMLYRLLKRHEKLDLPFDVVYFDMENSKGLLKGMGLTEFAKPGGRLIYYKGRKTWEQLDSFFEKLLDPKKKIEKYKNVKLVIIDSATAAISEKDIDMNCGDARFGTKAAACTRCLEKTVPLLESNQVSVIAIGQTRDNINQGFGQPDKKIAVSNALLYYSTVVMKLIKKVSTNDADVNKIKIKTAMGDLEIPEKFIITMQTTKGECKNRHGHVPDVDILVQYGKRVINQYILKQMLRNFGIVKDSLQVYTIPPEIIKGQKEELKLKRVDYNKFLSKNMEALISYLKKNNLYRVKLDTDENEDPDGFL